MIKTIEDFCKKMEEINEDGDKYLKKFFPDYDVEKARETRMKLREALENAKNNK